MSKNFSPSPHFGENRDENLYLNSEISCSVEFFYTTGPVLISNKDPFLRIMKGIEFYWKHRIGLPLD